MTKNKWYDRAWECMNQENYTQAKIYFEKAIEEGDVDAYCELGNLYFNGCGIEQDYKKAFDLYRKGAKGGNIPSIANLGICYFWGLGVNADLQKAAYYSKKAADMGFESAMYDSGLNYERGLGVQQDINKALYWLERAASSGYPKAFLELGNLYAHGILVEKDLEKSFKYYQKGAELGDNKSKISLAYFYEIGEVVEKDINKAQNLYQEVYDNYYELAVSNDDIEGQLYLGDIYFSGFPLLGISSDYNQAEQWYMKAANKNDDCAQNNLGIMYYYGIGVGQDYELAYKWFAKAAERMDVTALSNLGNCYYWGRGVEQDYRKAIEYHSKAANLGYANSQEVIGEMYLEGKGVEKNYIQGASWLQKSSDNGERSAFGPFGDCYKKGIGVEKNEAMAYELYQKGERLGDLRSKVSVAECLIEGCGVKYDIKHAISILEEICNNEKGFRENLITVSTRENDFGIKFIENPLEEVYLQYYAKAYYLLGTILYTNKGSSGDVSKAISLLRMADKLGYRNDDAPQETAEKLLNKIIGSTEKELSCNATDCYVEVRERNKIGERYEVVLHHTDGTESVVKFKGRNKFLYILALMIAHEGKSVCGMTTTHFAYWRDTLAMMAESSRINVDSYIVWIDEFVYAETDESKDFDEEITLCGFRGDKYSNALSGANRAIMTSCTSSDEFEIFKLRSTGGRHAITTMGLDYSQIKLPNSLEEYMNSLPTQKEISNCIPQKCRKLPRRQK